MERFRRYYSKYYSKYYGEKRDEFGKAVEQSTDETAKDSDAAQEQPKTTDSKAE